MDSSEIVDKFGINRKTFEIGGQRMLITDDDLILRNTEWRATDDKNFDQHALAHWWMNVYQPNGSYDIRSPQHIFSSWSSGLYHAFKYVMISGYTLETNQACAKIAVIRDESPLDHMNELLIWLPLIRPTRAVLEYDLTKLSLVASMKFHRHSGLSCDDELESVYSEFKYISILEDSLSEYGSYSLYVADNMSFVTMSRYGRHEILFASEKLIDTVGYIIKNCWYKESR